MTNRKETSTYIWIIPSKIAQTT